MNRGRQNRWVRWFGLCVSCILLFVILASLFYRYDARLFPILDVKVQGSYAHIPQQQIKSALLPYMQQGFFLVDLKQMQKALLDLTWVKQVNLSREWPSTLRISIQEYQPIARVNRNQFVTRDLEFFQPEMSSTLEKLPQVAAPQTSIRETVENFKKIQQRLLPLHVHVIKLQAQASLELMLTLDNGLIVQLGAAPHIYKRLNVFIALYQQLFMNGNHLPRSVDLRYPNGVAIAWN